jgi:hypothetical protein
MPGPPTESLNVLHRYRDALLEATESPQLSMKRLAIQGAAVYPFSEPAPGAFARSRLWTAMETLGIGAIPALPSDSHYLNLWIRNVLRHGGWALSDLAIRHTVTDRPDRWRHAQEQFVLVCAGPETPSIAIEAGRSIAEVAACVRVMFAEQIAPNEWSASAELPVLRLASVGDTMTLTLGHRMKRSDIRWRHAEFPVAVPFITTVLAADRALTAPELLLRTEVEWRLREQIAVMGLRATFEIAAGTDRLHPQLKWLLGPGSGQIERVDDELILRTRDGRQRRLFAIQDVLDELAMMEFAAR